MPLREDQKWVLSSRPGTTTSRIWNSAHSLWRSLPFGWPRLEPAGRGRSTSYPLCSTHGFLLSSICSPVHSCKSSIWSLRSGAGLTGVVVESAKPKRCLVVGDCRSSWLALTPVQNSIGAAATLLDAFVLVGSVAAQVLMVRGYVEAWAAWVVVNVVGTYHYAQQQLYFTGLLYFVLLLLAVWGWWQWSRKPAADSAAVEVTDVIEVQG